jgi:hypothetical protein
MSFRTVCRSCGKRLKLPDGTTTARAGKCPKCGAPVDLTAALEASAYMPPVVAPLVPVPADREDDPLPYAPPAPIATAPPPKPVSIVDREDDPLPYAPAPGPRPLPPPLPAPPVAPALAADDDTAPAPPVALPFRARARVVADSRREAVGPCAAVLLPHGLFLEHEPMKPFACAPPGCSVEEPSAGTLALTLPDGRVLAVSLTGRAGRALARDTAAFLKGEREVPQAADYRFKWWILFCAAVFAAGLAVGPLVLAHTANLSNEFALATGSGFALAGFLANGALALFSQRSVPAQVLTMAVACAVVSGVFFFGATAYLAGRQKGTEEVAHEPPPPAPPPIEVPKSALPKLEEPRPDRPPSHLDRARKSGASAIDDGPADVTALALAPDGNTLAIGHADGTTRLWPLDQPTFEPVQPGPKGDGPIARVQFDSKSQFVFAHTATGVSIAPRSGPIVPTARVTGTPVAVSPEVDGRIRYVAVRGNALQHRLLPLDFVLKPPKLARDFAVAQARDEIQPKEGKDAAKPANLTLLAWASAAKVVGAQQTGTVTVWNLAMRPEAPASDHKAPVKAWAACASGDFATGDDKGTVAFWSAKGGKPSVWPLFENTPVAVLALNATGTRLAAADGTGWLVVWDTATGKPAYPRTKRPAAVKALTFGPADDLMLVSSGRAVQVWALAELMK